MAQTVPDGEQTVCRLGAGSGESACAVMALLKPRVRATPRMKNCALRLGASNVWLMVSIGPRILSLAFALLLSFSAKPGLAFELIDARSDDLPVFQHRFGDDALVAVTLEPVEPFPFGGERMGR